MYKRVDGTVLEEPSFDGFSYINKDGKEESVEINLGIFDVVSINLYCCEKAHVYLEDIPNLIKALQATYNHIKG